MRLFRQVYGFVIRATPQGGAQLLVYRAADGSLRFPGGGLEEDEDLLAGLQRELYAESGLSRYVVLRKLGAQQYYRPDVQKHVEHHDYLLLAMKTLPDSFSHAVRGDGLVFDYRWIDRESVPLVHREFRQSLTPDYLPEFFNPPYV